MKNFDISMLKAGDFIRISGAYFTKNNGLYLVTDGAASPRYWGNSVYLKKVKKSGELCLNGELSLPLGYYCSDSRKNYEARQHDAENLKIEFVDGVPTYYAAEWFRERAAEYAERIEMATRRGDGHTAQTLEESRAHCAAAADRMSATAEEPKTKKQPEHGIRFYWNGIRVDGGRLIPCHYSVDHHMEHTECVTIYAREYSGDLPREYFEVVNESDGMTDYFEKDHTTLTPEHPLYRFARYVACKDRAKDAAKYIVNWEAELTGREPWRGHFDSLRERIAQHRKYIAEFERMKDPGQPKAADLEAVAEMKTAAESARIAAEHAAELAEREKRLRKMSEGRHWCEDIAAKHPIADGAPTVEIGFSESPYLYSFSHGADNVFSVAAAEIILKHFDELHHAEGRGYEKTDFTIRWTDAETAEEREYKGRYDLGDNDGGLIEHIRAFGQFCKDEQEGAEYCAVADYLETFTEGGRIVEVKIDQKIIDFALEKKKREAAEQAQDINDLFAQVAILTEAQIEAVIFDLNPKDKHSADIARFFLQELMRRDEKNALDVFRRWQAGA